MSSSDALYKGHVSNHCQIVSFWIRCLSSSHPFLFKDFLPSLPGFTPSRLHSFAKALAQGQRSKGWGENVSLWCRKPGGGHLSPQTPETLSNTDTEPSQLLLWHWTVVATTVVTSLKKAEQLARPGGCAPNLCTDSFVVHNGFRPSVTGARQKSALLLKTWLPPPHWSQCQNLLLWGPKGWAQQFLKSNTHTQKGCFQGWPHFSHESWMPTAFSWLVIVQNKATDEISGKCWHL